MLATCVEGACRRSCACPTEPGVRGMLRSSRARPARTSRGPRGPLTPCGMATRRAQTSGRRRRPCRRDRARGGGQIRVVDPAWSTRARVDTPPHHHAQARQRAPSVRTRTRLVPCTDQDRPNNSRPDIQENKSSSGCGEDVRSQSWSRNILTHYEPQCGSSSFRGMLLASANDAREMCRGSLPSLARVPHRARRARYDAIKPCSPRAHKQESAGATHVLQDGDEAGADDREE
jgi:hypothetical protein